MKETRGDTACSALKRDHTRDTLVTGLWGLAAAQAAA